VISEFTVERQAHGLYFETSFKAPSGDLFRGPSSLASYAAHTEGRRQYRVILLFTAQAIRPMLEGRRSLVSIIASPISTRRMRRYALSSRNFALDQSDESFREVMRTVIGQDRVIVENQRPEELPIDLSEELHLKGPDSGTLEYRRMLGELGLKQV